MLNRYSRMHWCIFVVFSHEWHYLIRNLGACNTCPWNSAHIHEYMRGPTLRIAFVGAHQQTGMIIHGSEMCAKCCAEFSLQISTSHQWKAIACERVQAATLTLTPVEIALSRIAQGNQGWPAHNLHSVSQSVNGQSTRKAVTALLEETSRRQIS